MDIVLLVVTHNNVESLGTCHGNMEKAVHCKCIDQGKRSVNYQTILCKEFSYYF